MFSRYGIHIFLRVQVWSKLENVLMAQDIRLPSAVGKVYQLHFDAMTLADGPLELRVFNYENMRASSRPSLLAKIKMFGAVDATVHLRDSDGRKIRGTEMEIPEIYIEGDVVVKYELMSPQKFSQLILFGFVQRPSVRLLNVKYSSSFPRGLFGEPIVNPVEGLQSAIEDMLETRGPDNSFSIRFDSPFDS